MLICPNCAPRFHFSFLTSPVTRRCLSTLAIHPNYTAHTNHLRTHPPTAHLTPTRHFSRDAQRDRAAWFAKFGRQSASHEQEEVDRQAEEDAAKRAILEKALEARQPADLMLRCSSLFNLSQSIALTPLRRHYIGRNRSVILHGLAPSSAVRTITGNVKTISGEFKKSELCMEHKLNVRCASRYSDLTAVYLRGLLATGFTQN